MKLEPSSVEADVYIRRYALPLVHARKEEELVLEQNFWRQMAQVFYRLDVLPATQPSASKH